MDKKEFIKQAARRKEFMTKLAKSFDIGNAMAVVGIIGAAVMVNQFVNRMIAYAENRSLQAEKPGYYKKLLEKNPQLLDEDPEEVMDLWDTLYRTAPSLAQDPIAAGGFLAQNLRSGTRRDLGGPPIDTYSTLTGIQEKMTKSSPKADFSLVGPLASGSFY